MAAWWGGDDSGSDSDLYESDEEQQKKKQPDRPVRTFTLDESSSEDEGTRKVRSKKESRFEDLRKSLALIENKRRNNDWIAIAEEWAALEKQVSKAHAVIEADGWPRFLVAGIVSLEDQLNKMSEDKSLKKSMKPQNYKSLTRSKQALKKFLKDQPVLEQRMAAFRASPEAESGDEGAEEAPQQGKGWLDDDLTFDDEDEAQDKDSDDDEDEEEDDDSDDEDVYIMGEKRDISYWFTPDKERPSKKKDKSQRLKEKEEKKKAAVEAGEEGDKDKDKDKQAPKEEKKEEWNQEKVDKKVKELLARRGTKNYDREDQLKQLTFLLTKAEGVQNVLALKFHQINAHLDAQPTGKTQHLPLTAWKKIYNLVVEVIRTLFEHKTIRLVESGEERVRLLGEEERPLPPDTTYGHLQFALDRLSEEFLKSMQKIDSHSQAYLARLAHEKDLLLLLQYAQSYYASTGALARQTLTAVRQLEHLYYKRQADLEALVLPSAEAVLDLEESEPLGLGLGAAELPELPGADEEEARAEEVLLERPPGVTPYANVTEAVEQLARLVYRDDAPERDRYKRRAMLQHVYHLALNDRYWAARDMLLMSHLQEKAYREKPAVQVLYNRTLVQLGLAAFRLGRAREAHAALAEIASSGRTKELLAQGLARALGERNPEQEADELRRQVPYHMHINLDLVETAHLVAAMLLEVPNIAHGRHRLAAGPTPQRKLQPISKHFRRLLDIHDRQVFSGPPENTRERVIAASRHLFQGDWRRAWEALRALEAWALIPQATSVQALYEEQLKEAALRTFLFSALPHYRALTLDALARMFALPPDAAHALVSRMIAAQELAAGWDQTTGTLAVHPGHAEPTGLQSFVLQFAERANALLEHADGQDQRQDRQRQGGPQQGGPQQGPQQQGAWLEQRPGGQQQRTMAPRSERQLKGQLDRKLARMGGQQAGSTAQAPNTAPQGFRNVKR